MSDDTDISRLLPNMNADERRVWETIKAEKAAGATAERLAGLECQAAGIRRSEGRILEREYEASGRERPRTATSVRGTVLPRVDQPPHSRAKITRSSDAGYHGPPGYHRSMNGDWPNESDGWPSSRFWRIGDMKSALEK